MSTSGTLSPGHLDKPPPMMVFDPEPPIVVFDFDKTLSTTHIDDVGGGDDVATTVFGGKDRLAMLTRMFRGIAAAGCQAVVLTFNKEKIVKDALSKAGLLKKTAAFGVASHDILGVESLARKDEGKGEVITREWLDMGPRWVCFVDDSHDNITNVKKLCPSSGLLEVAGGRGLDQLECDQIAKWCEERKAG